MRSNIKLGTISGIEIGLHYSWFIIAALIAFSLSEHFRQVNPSTLGESGIVSRSGGLAFQRVFVNPKAPGF